MQTSFEVLYKFQSTLSVRRATAPNMLCQKPPALFQSTLSVRRATFYRDCTGSGKAYFNPRSPWGERPLGENHTINQARFQSTLSVRRATQEQNRKHLSLLIFQSTLSVRRATENGRLLHNLLDISIHALREESDHHQLQKQKYLHNFNPRSPWGERLCNP